MNLPDKFSSKYKGSCQVTIDKCSINSKIRFTDLMNILQALAGKHSDLGINIKLTEIILEAWMSQG